MESCCFEQNPKFSHILNVSIEELQIAVEEKERFEKDCFNFQKKSIHPENFEDI